MADQIMDFFCKFTYIGARRIWPQGNKRAGSFTILKIKYLFKHNDFPFCRLLMNLSPSGPDSLSLMEIERDFIPTKTITGIINL